VLQAAPAGEGLFARYDFAAMARAQQQVRATSSVPVAPVRWHEMDASVLGVPFYVMERVRGRAPTDRPPYHRAGWFADLSAQEQRRAWWSGIEAMAKLHALEVEADGFGFMQHAPWGMAPDADAARTRLRQWRDFLRWADPEPLPIVDAAFDELERSCPAPAPLRVHWGDAKLSNCMVEGEVRALLDWELCGLSVPEEDLMHWLMLDWSLWAVAGAARLPSLPDAAATIARYEALSDREVQAPLWWWRFGLVRLAVIYHRILSLLRRRGHAGTGKTLADANPITPFIAPVFEKDGLP